MDVKAIEKVIDEHSEECETTLHQAAQVHALNCTSMYISVSCVGTLHLQGLWFTFYILVDFYPLSSLDLVNSITCIRSCLTVGE